MRARTLIGGAAAALLLVLTSGHARSQQDVHIYVIAHTSVTLRDAGQTVLAAIFASRRQFDDAGTRLVPLNHPPTSLVRHAFDHAVLGLNPDQVSTYWIDQRVRGRERPPRQIPAELIARVVGHLPGAIAYTDSPSIAPNVKILAEIRNANVVPR